MQPPRGRPVAARIHGAFRAAARAPAPDPLSGGRGLLRAAVAVGESLEVQLGTEGGRGMETGMKFSVVWCSTGVGFLFGPLGSMRVW